jgi:hypothetical protein
VCTSVIHWAPPERNVSKNFRACSEKRYPKASPKADPKFRRRDPKFRLGDPKTAPKTDPKTRSKTLIQNFWRDYVSLSTITSQKILDQNFGSGFWISNFFSWIGCLERCLDQLSDQFLDTFWDPFVDWVVHYLVQISSIFGSGGSPCMIHLLYILRARRRLFFLSLYNASVQRHCCVV